MTLTVRDAMTHLPVRIHAHDRLELAASMMARAGIGQLPVVDERGALIGVLSTRDVARAFVGTTRRRPADSPLRVADIMTGPLLTTPPDAPLGDAILRLVGGRLSALPVLGDGELVGILTVEDCVAVAAERLDTESLRRRDAVLVSRLMTTGPVLTVSMRDSLITAEERMREADCRHALVVDQMGELVAIVSQRDLASRGATVGDVMTVAPITVRPDTAAADAARRLLTAHISALPVMHGRQPIGLLTETDLLAHLIAALPERRDPVAAPPPV